MVSEEILDPLTGDSSSKSFSQQQEKYDQALVDELLGRYQYLSTEERQKLQVMLDLAEDDYT